ncbi:MAG: hypothetical protein ACI9WU_004294, partial [Myxococcota bacterium]
MGSNQWLWLVCLAVLAGAAPGVAGALEPDAVARLRAEAAALAVAIEDHERLGEAAAALSVHRALADVVGKLAEEAPDHPSHGLEQIQVLSWLSARVEKLGRLEEAVAVQRRAVEAAQAYLALMSGSNVRIHVLGIYLEALRLQGGRGRIQRYASPYDLAGVGAMTPIY